MTFIPDDDDRKWGGMTPPNPPTFTEPQVLAILRNMGHDVECGACMAIAFTGVGFPGDKHTCNRDRLQSAELAELRGRMEALRKRLVVKNILGGLVCTVCGEGCDHGAPERHQKDCPARPLPTPPTEAK